ncbi:kelch-like protein 30 isoform X2 [Phacochoerus africanus]|uniref:kelch-like protein 30 isoform X2 n=1 Tax=Phacochoerus africanus TaxID=41426 RepID=UPI001FDA4328|nr:kelch-like protein 30 isoform X2 [Phacochoerus africanus]
MVRNVDDLDFHLPSHAQDMLDGLQRLRSQPKLADVTLLVGGRELPCHRGLLALSSPYFHAMFAGDFAESFSARVELRDVEPAGVAQLVDFVYTGRLTITQANVEALTRTAARLHFPAVQKVCGRYLQQQLDATNCLGICEFGEQQGLLGVAAKAWAFLRENFEAVAREDEFLQLSQERLATCLASDLLQVQPEQSRLEALLRWVRHDSQARAAHLPELLGLVHLDAVPRPHMQQLLATEPLIRESEACREALSQGHEAALLALPQKLEEVLVVVGGRALEEEEGAEELAPQPGNFAFYDTKAQRWMALPDFPDYHKWGFSLAALNNDVYVTGLVLPAEGGGLEARGAHAEGPHEPCQRRTQRGDLRHRRYHAGRGGGGELRPLHGHLDARQPGPQVRQQLLGGRLRGPPLPGGLQRLQVQRAGSAVLQPRRRRVERDRLPLPPQVPVLAALRGPAGGALPRGGQHQESLCV